MQRLTLKQLTTIKAVSKFSTIVAAADELGVTAAALTARIKLLEEDAGVPLFDRTSGRLRVNAAGQEVVNVATRIEQLLTELNNSLSAHRDMGLSHVTIGVVSTAKYFAPRLLAAFMREHTDIELSIIVGNRSETITALRDYAIDIALMGRPPLDFPVHSGMIGPHPQVLVAPPNHPLAHKRRLKRTDLANESFLVREEGSGSRSIFEYFFDGIIIQPPRVKVEIGSNETIKQAVMAGLGLTLISAHTVEAEVADGRLVVLDVDGLPIIRQWFIVRHANRTLSAATSKLWDFILKDGRMFLPSLHPERIRPAQGDAFPPQASSRFVP